MAACGAFWDPKTCPRIWMKVVWFILTPFKAQISPKVEIRENLRTCGKMENKHVTYVTYKKIQQMGCGRKPLTSEPLPGLFLLAWLCLLTRRFCGPEGSALVPGRGQFWDVLRCDQIQGKRLLTKNNQKGN